MHRSPVVPTHVQTLYLAHRSATRALRMHRVRSVNDVMFFVKQQSHYMTVREFNEVFTELATSLRHLWRGLLNIPNKVRGKYHVAYSNCRAAYNIVEPMLHISWYKEPENRYVIYCVMYAVVCVAILIVYSSMYWEYVGTWMSAAVRRNARYSMSVITVMYAVSLVTSSIAFYALFAAYSKYKFATNTTKK